MKRADCYLGGTVRLKLEKTPYENELATIVDLNPDGESSYIRVELVRDGEPLDVELFDLEQV